MTWMESFRTSAIFSAALLFILYCYLAAPMDGWIDGLVQRIEGHYKGKEKKRAAAVQRETPLQKCGVEKQLRQALEDVLIAYEKANKNLLPKMDKAFRQQAEQQINLLNRSGLRRRFQFEHVESDPKGFRKWNDGGREWREGEITACVTESFIGRGSEPVSQTKFNAVLNIRQSRHIRESDRRKGQASYYGEDKTYVCQSCGAELKLDSNQVNCPYCGAHIVSHFYDWQTERLVLARPTPETAVRRMNALLQSAAMLILWVLAAFLLLFVPAVLLTRLLGWERIALAFLLSIVISVILLVLLVTLSQRDRTNLEKQIVRYSERYLCGCIGEYLWLQEKDPNILDYFISDLVLNKVENTDDTTAIEADVTLTKTWLEQEKTRQKKERYLLGLSRARYPDRLRQDGIRLEEKECPSCGGNFIPDENGCCAYCGYSLKVDNAKWKVMSMVSLNS